MVWCEVIIPAKVPPHEGAAAAKAMATFLVDSILVPRSAWGGVVLDVRKGPSVIGPITVAVNEGILKAAEHARKPIAVLIGPSPILHGQYSSLCRDFSPRYSTVTTEPHEAVDWLMKARSGQH